MHAAHLVDRVGAALLLQPLQDRFPRISHLFADKAYTGPLIDWIKAHLGWTTEIVPKLGNEARSEWYLIDGVPVQFKKPTGGFQVQRQRWKIERTFGWLIRHRRLARDYEGLPRSAEAMIHLAAIHRFLVRLTPFRPLRA